MFFFCSIFSFVLSMILWELLSACGMLVPAGGLLANQSLLLRSLLAVLHVHACHHVRARRCSRGRDALSIGISAQPALTWRPPACALPRSLGLFGASAFFPLITTLLEKYLVSRIVSGNNLKMPRAYLYYDLVLSFSIAITAGLSSAFIRLISGLFTAYTKLVMFQMPVMPDSMGTSDAGLSSYGSLMKCRYLCIFEELGLVDGHFVEYTPSEEWYDTQRKLEVEHEAEVVGPRKRDVSYDTEARGLEPTRAI
jgi:hypothetical protein